MKSSTILQSLSIPALDTQEGKTDPKLDAILKKGGILNEVNELRKIYFPHCSEPEQQQILKYAKHIAQISSPDDLYINDSEINTINPSEHLGFHVAMATLDRGFIIENDYDSDIAARVARTKKFVTANYLMPKRFWCPHLKKSYDLLAKSKSFFYGGRSQAEKMLETNPNAIYIRPSSLGPNVWVRTMNDENAHQICYLHSTRHALIIKAETGQRYRRRTLHKDPNTQIKAIAGIDVICSPTVTEDMTEAASYIFYKPGSDDYERLKKQYDADARFKPIRPEGFVVEHKKPNADEKSENYPVSLVLEFAYPDNFAILIPSEKNRLEKFSEHFKNILLMVSTGDFERLLYAISACINQCDLNRDWHVYKELVNLESLARKMSETDKMNSSVIIESLTKINQLCCTNGPALTPKEQQEQTKILALQDQGLFFLAGDYVINHYIEGSINVVCGNDEKNSMLILKNFTARKDKILAHMLPSPYPKPILEIIADYSEWLRYGYRMSSEPNTYVLHCLDPEDGRVGAAQFPFKLSDMTLSLVEPEVSFVYKATYQATNRGHRRINREEVAEDRNAFFKRTEIVKHIIQKDLADLFAATQTNGLNRKRFI